ncbi:MAG: energy-coupling factor transporter transmembrane protein EcfT [Deltaproteobacteria bacterium]|nr:energy-coupling factor transporter transmembrane protein EcfT [Deltaproteobacteria bacterium]
MKLFLYLDRESVVHRLHPVTKLVALPVLFGVAMRLERLETLALLALVVVVVAALGRALDAVAGMASLLLTLLIATTLMWWLFAPQGGLLRDGFQPAALARSAGLGLRLALMVASGIVFLATTRVEDFAHGLRTLGLPYRVAFALTLAFRLVPTFVASGRAVAEAQRARGLDLDHGGLVTRMRRYTPLVVPMFLTSIRRADRLAAALETRGFGSGEKRTDLVEHRFGGRDALAAVLLVGLVAASLWGGELASQPAVQAALGSARAWLEALYAKAASRP